MGLLWIILSGCAGTMVQKEVAALPRDARAMLFFKHFDRIVEKYGVSDASVFPVPGFPNLRSNRFLAAMKERLANPGDEVYWAGQLLKLGSISRRKEIANLPVPAIRELSQVTGETIDRETIRQNAENHAYGLFRDDQSQPGFMDRLKGAVTVPDEYSGLARFLGLYPLAGIPVTIGTAMAYSRYEAWHQTALENLETDGRMIRFFPAESDSVVDETFINSLYDPLSLDTFGLPVLTDADERRLAIRFAPVLYQDVAEVYDRIGRILWQESRVRVDSGQPTAYFYTSRSFLGGHPVLQMNYAFWYSERAGENAPGIERGPLDGLSYRITLDWTGNPVMVDVMNSCGCYHFFVPRKDNIAKVVTKPGEIAPLVPAWLPAAFPEKQMHLRVNSGWHQVQNIFADDMLADGAAYELVPYEALESLPKGAGQRESVFTARGIMKDSWRIEPYIFFSMGIHHIGYMRQRGHHAIKMVGRGHFTDPGLFDRSFLFKDPMERP